MKEFKYFSRARLPTPCARSTAGREFPSQLPDPTTVLRSVAALLKQFADSARSPLAPTIFVNRGLTETPVLIGFVSPSRPDDWLLLGETQKNFLNNFISKRVRMLHSKVD